MCLSAPSKERQTDSKTGVGCVCALALRGVHVCVEVWPVAMNKAREWTNTHTRASVCVRELSSEWLRLRGRSKVTLHTALTAPFTTGV